MTVFQPHRYSRTRDHFEDFVAVLGECQILVLLEVYAAGEMPVAGATSAALAQAIRDRGWGDPVVVPDHRGLSAVLSELMQDQDILLMQGAGDIGRLSASLADCGSLEVPL